MGKITIKFKSDKAASEFATNLSVLEGRADVAVIDGGSVVITSNDTLAMAFAKNMVDEIKEEIMCINGANRLLKAITESITSESTVEFRMMNGDLQPINPRHARALALMHDTLSEAKQTAFLVFAVESKQGYEQAVNFARANDKGEIV